ncbi:MAG: helix-turn-helix domain-containing protein [Clostridiaceae bacterium]|nr:helix-turn-helix domain-containing protein [Clostridiaceae bacterium]
MSIISFDLFEKDIMQKNAVLLNHIKETFDTRLSEISKLGYEISFNDRLLNLSKSGSVAENSDAALLSAQLRMLKSTSEVIGSIAIYFPESNLVISDSGRFSVRCFYRLYHADNDLSYQNYLASLAGKHTLEYIISDDVPNSGKPEINLYFYHTIPLAGKGSASPLLLIRLDTTKIQSMIKTVISSNSEYFSILDDQNRPIVYSGNQQLLQRVGDDILSGRTSEVRNIASGSLMISQVSSWFSGLHYVSISEKSTLLSTLNDGKNVLIAGISIIFIFGFLISFYFSKKTERPIMAITKAVGDKEGPSKKNTDVYAYLEDRVNRIMEEHTSLAKRLENQNLLLRNVFLIRLLKGDLDNADEYQRLCRQYDIDISREHHCVFILYVQNVAAAVEKTTTNFTGMGDTVSTLVAAAVHQLCGEDYGAELVSVDGLYTVWLTLSDNEAPETLKERYCRRLIEKIHDEYQMETSVASGNVYDSFIQIPLSYAESVQALENLIADKEVRYITYGAVRLIETKSKNLAIEQLAKFVNCLKLQDYGNAYNLIDDLFEVYLPPHLTRELYLLHRNTLVSVLMHTVEQAGQAYGRPDYCQCYQRLQAAAQRRESLKDQAGLVLQDIIAAKHQTETKDFSKHIASLRDYINQNYNNSDLGLYMLASHFNMNNSYLSKIFKNEFDIGVLDYINKVRIDKAKIMLAETDQSIIQIAQAVGYISDITFIRVFKRYEGTTPGRYRDSLGNQA